MDEVLNLFNRHAVRYVLFRPIRPAGASYSSIWVGPVCQNSLTLRGMPCGT